MCTILSGNTAADARNTHWKQQGNLSEHAPDKPA